MKSTFYICMTSGIEGPKAELTEEFSKEISDLALQLDKSWESYRLAGMGLGIDHYMVYWGNDAPIISLSVDGTGYVSMWKNGDTDWQTFKDTVGLWARLAPTGSSAYQKWVEGIESVVAVTSIFNITGS